MLKTNFELQNNENNGKHFLYWTLCGLFSQNSFLVVLLGFVFLSNKQRMPYNRYTYIFQ